MSVACLTGPSFAAAFTTTTGTSYFLPVGCSTATLFFEFSVFQKEHFNGKACHRDTNDKDAEYNKLEKHIFFFVKIEFFPLERFTS